MKKSIKLAGIIAIVVVIGFLFIACKTTKGELDGTSWRGSSEGVVFIISFSSPNFTLTGIYDGETETTKGTYSISGSTVTLTFDGDTEIGTLSENRLIIEGTTFIEQ